MRLKLHWAQRFEMVREFPAFELDSSEFPELELEMLQVYNARTDTEQQGALGELEYKMQHSTMGERGETIFKMIGAADLEGPSHTYPISDGTAGFYITPTEE